MRVLFLFYTSGNLLNIVNDNFRKQWKSTSVAEEFNFDRCDNIKEALQSQGVSRSTAYICHHRSMEERNY
jgi:hypothetical protein